MPSGHYPSPSPTPFTLTLTLWILDTGPHPNAFCLRRFYLRRAAHTPIPYNRHPLQPPSLTTAIFEPHAAHQHAPLRPHVTPPRVALPSAPHPPAPPTAYFCFSLCYLAEGAAELASQPWELYFVAGRRRLQLGISLAVAAISLLWVVPFVSIPYAWMRYANTVRVLKLVELLHRLSAELAFVLGAISAVIRGSVDVLGQLLLWTSFFAVLGCQLFGGAVYATNPALEGTEYQRSFYGVLNLNDFAMGFMPLLTTLVAAGPNAVLVEGIGAAAGRPRLAKALFLAYYYSTQLLVLNIFISFLLNGYGLRHDARQAGDAETIDGLDASQRANLESLYTALPHEEGWVVRVSGREGQDVLLRRMFADDIRAAIEVASDQQTSHGLARGRRRQRASSAVSATSAVPS